MNYRIQQIEFNGKRTHRILQNVGGPCPLIGLCNALLLQNDIRVNQKVSSIKFSDLTFCLKDHLQKLFEVNISSNKNVEQSQMANAIQNIEDCVALFPKLEEGLDMNIKFNGELNEQFEFTPAVAMFDNYNIRILHGWAVDPQNKELFQVLNKKTYNETVDFLTSDDESDAQKESDKLLIREFLSQYSQQLTAHGLFKMHEIMNENEIAIFFRNNHFSTVYKHKGHIYELVTDEGIVDADRRIIWQSLSQLSGDEQFLSKNFQIIQANYSQEKRIRQFNEIRKQQNENSSNNTQNNNNNSKNDENESKIDNNDNNNSNNSKAANANSNIGNEPFTYEQQEKHLNMQFNNSTENLKAAQNIALEQELGISAEELNQLKKEQNNAMKQIENKKNRNNYNHYNGNAYNGNNNSNNNVNSNAYENTNAYKQARIKNQNKQNYAYARNHPKQTTNKNARRKKSDDCVVL